MDLKYLMDSPEYATVSADVRERLGIGLFPTYNDALASVMQGRILKSGLPVQQLADTLARQTRPFTAYVIGVVKALHGKPIEQEYPKGQEPDPDDAWKPLADLGFAKDFLVGHLITYTLIQQHPEKLETYLKETRIPNARQHAALLRRLHQEAGG
jgi:hypothetical protein